MVSARKYTKVPRVHSRFDILEEDIIVISHCSQSALLRAFRMLKSVPSGGRIASASLATFIVAVLLTVLFLTPTQCKK